MSNHSNNECGILHPEMSKARAAGRAKEGAKAAGVQAQLINELKAEVNAIKSMAMAAALPGPQSQQPALPPQSPTNRDREIAMFMTLANQLKFDVTQRQDNG